MIVCGAARALIKACGFYEGECTMRKNRWIKPGLAAAVAVAAVIASFLALASGGQAASPNICKTQFTGTTNASCMTETVLPHFLTAGQDGVSVTEFRNESGIGGATATHVVVSVAFSTSVAIKSTTLLINDSLASTASCTPTAPATATKLSCPAGDIAGGGTVRLIVRFSTSTTALTLTGMANYGESGNDNPKNNPNDLQQARDTLTISDTANGKCVPLNPNEVTTLSASSTTTQSTQSTSATYGSVTPSLHLDCTPAETGVLNSSPSPLKTQISFVEFLTFDSGYATVTIDITPLPTNLNKFKLLEDTQYALPYFATYITVPNGCDASGLPPNPGVPAPGATDSSTHLNDTCISSRSSLPKGGGRFVLHVIGSPLDGHYGG
jgi:hypothetical protein